jgi:hypothetical protein
MKLIKIEVNKECDKTMILGELELYPVTLTFKTLFGKVKTVLAYPTSYGPTYWSNFIHFYYYIDETGKQLSGNISEKITNFCKTLRFK